MHRLHICFDFFSCKTLSVLLIMEHMYISRLFVGQQLCARFKDYPIGTFGTTDDEVTNCTWEIQGQTGDRVQLQFMWLHIPLDDDCSQEYVEVLSFFPFSLFSFLFPLNEDLTVKMV